MEPFGERREDYRNAHLIACLANILARQEGQEAYKAEDFLLKFKSEESRTEQTPEQIEAAIKVWVAAANIAHRVAEKRKS